MVCFIDSATEGHLYQISLQTFSPIHDLSFHSLDNVIEQKTFNFRDIFGGPVVKTLRFQCRGRGFDPWLRN